MSKADRIARARKALPEIVYRSMRLEGDDITREQAVSAIVQAELGADSPAEALEEVVHAGVWTRKAP